MCVKINIKYCKIKYLTDWIDDESGGGEDSGGGGDEMVVVKYRVCTVCRVIC